MKFEYKVLNSNDEYIKEENVRNILTNVGYSKDDDIVVKYEVQPASNHMLGFLADYWKLKVDVLKKTDKKILSFFIKAVSRTNEAKSKMLMDLKLLQKEVTFYTKIKSCLDLPGLKPISTKMVADLADAMVFPDLNVMQYNIRHKHDRFDMNHTLQALNTLARFHASCIVYEETRSLETHMKYRMFDDHPELLTSGAYINSSIWFSQCMKGNLEALKIFSKYSSDQKSIDLITCQWPNVWAEALRLHEHPCKSRSVLCHSDLWNNNLMFHYSKSVNDEMIPDDCVLVDFQAMTYQEPAADVMLLLCCNLDPEFRKKHIEVFLDYYYQELKSVVSDHSFDVKDILSEEEFTESAERQILWGLVGCACLIPVFWLNDDVTTDLFSDSVQFDDILNKNKAAFMIKVMKNNHDYKTKVMEIIEEIVEKYCLPEQNETI